MVPPIIGPKERLIIKYSPPPSTLRFVEISAMAMAVGMVIKCPIKIIKMVPIIPACATAYPKRRNRMAPNIVLMAARKTGAVPNPYPLLPDVFFAKVFSPMDLYN